MRIFLMLVLMVSILFACQNSQEVTATDGEVTTEHANMPKKPAFRYMPPDVEGEVTPIEKTAEEWANILTAKEFHILREGGTERSFTGDLLSNTQKGVYTSASCGLPLFRSETKYKSGTGWPSFYELIHPNYIEEEVDNSHGMRRIEVRCARCGSHLGHVFPDGPEPTGLRYCINSAALDFVPDK